MFATVDEIKARTAFKTEIAALSDDEIASYIRRAERWIYHATQIDYSTTTDEGTLEDLKTADVHLIDLLWYQDQPDAKEDNLSGIQQEQIGSYQYTKMAKATPQSDSTGIQELDMILDGLTPKIQGVSFFSVSGPGRCQ